MTLPRPVLIALLGLALVAAAFLATRSANDTGGAVTSTPAVPAPPKAAIPARKPGARKSVPAPGRPADRSRAAGRPATAQKPAARPKPATPPSQPAKVLPAIRALGRGDVVVFFFTRPGPADDTATRRAVRSLSGEKGVSVFTAGLNELETYRPILSGAGVSQVPAVVVVRAGKKARLIEGFVDSATLRQTVADARR